MPRKPTQHKKKQFRVTILATDEPLIEKAWAKAGTDVSVQAFAYRVMMSAVREILASPDPAQQLIMERAIAALQQAAAGKTPPKPDDI